MKTKTIITFLLIGFTTILFSQTKSINANTSYTGLNCRGNSSAPCAVDYVPNKSLSNTQISFNNENNELIFIISKAKIDTTSKSKLLDNKLEKDIYLYSFDEDFILSDEIKTSLGIKEYTKI